MRVKGETGQERAAGHMPPLSHHVAPAASSWQGCCRLKASSWRRGCRLKVRGNEAVTALRSHSTPRNAAVMVDGTLCLVGEEAENKAEPEQGMLVIMQWFGCAVADEIPPQRDMLITQPILELVHLVKGWNLRSAMVRPRQRLLSG